MKPFVFSTIPRLTFGAGAFATLVGILASYGPKSLVLTGRSSFETTGKKRALEDDLNRCGISASFETVSGEPTPELVDSIVRKHRTASPDTVCAIGGGSVIDAGKAIAAMLTLNDTVYGYLEGSEHGLVHNGRTLPLVAVPTTAGTGSEATKNAVLSNVGDGGFKRSLRHDNFVPARAVVDPELALTCPRAVTSASGMDAICQLIESYVSTKANPMTDTLSLSGLEHAAASFLPACGDGAGDVEVRAGMAYAAFLSGVTLANAGLGVVHGFASSVGGMFPIPHGVVCGTLLAECTRVTIARLREAGECGLPSLAKYSRAGEIITGGQPLSVDNGCDALIETLAAWTDALDIPRLGVYGMKAGDIDAVAASTGCKNNPVVLSRDDLSAILESRL
jgi:alcohol dehydrogenase class IV